MIADKSRFMPDYGLGFGLDMRAAMMWLVIVRVPCTSF